MISGMEPSEKAITGVPQALASTTDKPKGSLKLIGCNRHAAPPRSLSRYFRADTSHIFYPAAIQMGLNLGLEIALVLNYSRYQQIPVRQPSYLDGFSDTLVGMNSAKEEQVFSIRWVET